MKDSDFIIPYYGQLTSYRGDIHEKHIVVPDNVSYIKKGVFKDLMVEEVTLPQYLFDIESGAFDNCPYLTTINFPQHIGTFNKNTFVNCPNLKEIIIDDDDPAFEYKDGLLINKVENKLYYCSPTKEGEVVVPDNITKIADFAFSSCYKIKTLKLSSNIKRIDRENIIGLKSVETLVLSQSTDLSYSRVLQELPNLKQIEYYTEGRNCCIDHIIYSGNKTILRYILNCHGDYLKLEPTLEHVEFSDISAQNIKTLYIPKEVNLHLICYPSDYSLIYDLPSLEHFIFEDKKAKVYLNWFAQSDYYDEIKVTKRLLRFIKDFYPSQIDLNIRRNILNEVSDILLNDTSVDKEWKDSWLTHFSRNRKKYFEYLPTHDLLLKLFLENKILKLDDVQIVINLMNDSNKVELVALLLEYQNNNFTFEEVSKKQEEELFMDTSSLSYIKKTWLYKIKDDGNIKITGYKGNETLVIVPSTIAGHTVDEIGSKAFCPDNTRKNNLVKEARNRITTIVLSDTIKNIGVLAFANCKSLLSIEFPSTMNFYFDNTIYNSKNYGGILSGCSNLTKLVIPEGVEYLGENFFENCNQLQEISLPSTLKIIDSCCFNYCSKLKKIRIPSNVALIKNDAFGYKNTYSYYGHSFAEYNIPDIIEGVKGSYAERFAKQNGVQFKSI